MKYVLFGTGDYFRRFIHWFADRDVAAILDNDEGRQGTELDGHPVIAPSDIDNTEYDAIVILSFYVAEMKKQLLGLGVPESRIYHFYDLHELFRKEKPDGFETSGHAKSILLLSHDLTFGGPALALYHASVALKKAGYEAVFGSMIDGELREKLKESFIPVIIDERLQVGTMKELKWTAGFDLIICNTINYNVFLSDRDPDIPVIWWLHDSPFFYEGIKAGRLADIDLRNMKILSVGPVPENAMKRYRPDVVIEDLIYGVSDGI